LAELGRAALIVSFVLALYACVVGGAAAVSRQRRLADSARNALIACFGSTLIAALILAKALVDHNFTFQYVQQHTSRDLSTVYSLTAFWGGEEGSLAGGTGSKPGLVGGGEDSLAPPALPPLNQPLLPLFSCNQPSASSGAGIGIESIAAHPKLKLGKSDVEFTDCGGVYSFAANKSFNCATLSTRRAALKS